MRTTRRKQSAPLCISGNEMERLRSFTRPPPKKEEDLRNEHLKKLSEDRVKNWPNTLAAQRKKKEQWKEIRAAEEEAYRVKVDNEERELREAAAAKAYAKAKYLKFENQDKTKYAPQRCFTSSTRVVSMRRGRGWFFGQFLSCFGPRRFYTGSSGPSSCILIVSMKDKNKSEKRRS